MLFFSLCAILTLGGGQNHDRMRSGLSRSRYALFQTCLRRRDDMLHKKILVALCVLILSGIFLCGCRNSEERSKAPDDSKHPPADQSRHPRDNTPVVRKPEASADVVLGNDFLTIDISHANDGYFMVRYLGENEKVKLRVTGPGPSEYIYLLSGSKEYETFPLPCGSGDYQVQILEHAGNDMYAVAYSDQFQASITDAYSPFLYPNQYVNFTEDMLTVAKGSELAAQAYSDLDVITNIYHFVTKEIAYDEKKAASVSYGYLPVVDETLTSGKGICFDYAAVMCAMLRSQRIPAKLEVGYSGEAYHAWISAYVTEIGWVDDIIEFDGKSWTLMDPTLAANNSASAVKEYIGDGSNYTVKYSY